MLLISGISSPTPSSGSSDSIPHVGDKRKNSDSLDLGSSSSSSSTTHKPPTIKRTYKGKGGGITYSRYAIMDFKVCHHGFQGMPSWTTRFARRESFLQDSTCLNASLFLPISPYLLSGPVFYSVEIHSNVIMYERPLVSHLLPPHPEIERERYSLMQKLRLSYRELCYARESTPQMLTARER